MSTDADDLHRQFLVQSAMSAIDAIDDIITAKVGTHLSEEIKDQVGRILEAGFRRVMSAGRIGDSDQITAETIWGVIDLEVYGEDPSGLQDNDEADLAFDIKAEVLRAFGNFAEAFVNLLKDELRRRGEGL